MIRDIELAKAKRDAESYVESLIKQGRIPAYKEKQKVEEIIREKLSLLKLMERPMHKSKKQFSFA